MPGAFAVSGSMACRPRMPRSNPLKLSTVPLDRLVQFLVIAVLHQWAGGSRAESGVSGWANLTKSHPEVETRFESASIRERILVTRPKRSSVVLAAASFLRMPSSSAACNCCSWSFHCTRTARFCSAVSSLDSLNASGVAKTLAGLLIALSMSIATYDSALATFGAVSQ